MVKSSLVKLLISIILVFSVLTVATQAFAEGEDATTSPRVRNLEPDRMMGNSVGKREIKEITQDKRDFRRESAASKSAVLKERLRDFKDKLKASIVERVSNNLNRINQNQTTQMKNHLERMSSILTKVKNRVNQSGVVGNGVSAAISDSEVAIASASAAVTNQALNDYTLTVSSETAARLEAKETRDKLHADLKAVRQQVIAAKQSLSNAVRVVITSLGGSGGQ